MPAFPSALTTRRAHRVRAFTLIELLVVLVIIAIITAVAVLSLGILGDDRNLRTETRRLSTLIQLANDEATILGRDFGIEFTDTGYRFVEFDPLLTRWYEVIGDDILRARELEEGLEFDLFLEDRRVLLEEQALAAAPPVLNEDGEYETEEDDDDLTDDYEPHVLIMSSGDVSPFELRILRPSDRQEMTLTMLPNGDIEIVDDENAPL